MPYCQTKSKLLQLIRRTGRQIHAQVQEAIDDLRPSIAHDDVMALMRAIIAAKREKRSNNQS